MENSGYKAYRLQTNTCQIKKTRSKLRTLLRVVVAGRTGALFDQLPPHWIILIAATSAKVKRKNPAMKTGPVEHSGSQDFYALLLFNGNVQRENARNI